MDGDSERTTSTSKNEASSFLLLWDEVLASLSACTSSDFKGLSLTIVQLDFRFIYSSFFSLMFTVTFSFDYDYI